MKPIGWQPRYDDLSTIVRDALNWERELMTRRAAHSLPRPRGRGEELAGCCHLSALETAGRLDG